MPYGKCKIYSDGSHYIAIPYIPRKPRLKKGVKVKKPAPELEEFDAEDEVCPFDMPVQLTFFDKEKNAPKEITIVHDSQENALTHAKKENVSVPLSRKDLFEQSYKEHLSEPYGKRKKSVLEDILPYFKDYEDAELFAELNFRRKRRNLIIRRIRLTRKINLQDFNYFVTFTYSDALHTEESFRKKLINCLVHFHSRKGWKYIGVWERSPEKQRLHFHGIFSIPDGTMPGFFFEQNDYNFNTHRRQTTIQNTYFNDEFGRSDFEDLTGDNISFAVTYILKYIEKSGERLVYSKGLPQFFLSEIMEDDIVCSYGTEETKFLLYDDFGCWDEGEYKGQVCKEVIDRLPKSN